MKGQKKINKRFKKYFAKHGQFPSNFKELLKSQEKKKDFKGCKTDSEEILTEILEAYFTKTIKILERDSNYEGMSVREKLLSFYFVLFEIFEQDEAFVKALFHPRQIRLSKRIVSTFRPHFHSYLESIIHEGLLNEEIKSRNVLDRFYAKALEKDLVLLIKFWMKDQSDGKEKTDEMIERLVNLEMNVLGPNFTDDLIGMAKMLLENSPLMNGFKR